MNVAGFEHGTSIYRVFELKLYFLDLIFLPYVMVRFQILEHFSNL